MFSDIYKIKEVANGLCLEVEGKVGVYVCMYVCVGCAGLSDFLSLCLGRCEELRGATMEVSIWFYKR